MLGLNPLSSKMQLQNFSEKKCYSFNFYIYKQSNFYTAELCKFCYILPNLPLTQQAHVIFNTVYTQNQLCLQISQNMSPDTQRLPEIILGASCKISLQIYNINGTQYDESSPSLFQAFPGVRTPQKFVSRACDDLQYKVTESPTENYDRFGNPLENLFVI